MLKLKRNMLSVALASATVLIAAGAQAQSTEESTSTANKSENESRNDQAVDLDRVKVTGIRRGIEDAISVKRDSTSIVDAISAEDIGKLPDVTIGESISRLPGVSGGWKRSLAAGGLVGEVLGVGVGASGDWRARRA